MGPNYAASNNLHKDTISSWFFAKFSLMCRHDIGSSPELSGFFMIIGQIVMSFSGSFT